MGQRAATLYALLMAAHDAGAHQAGYPDTTPAAPGGAAFDAHLFAATIALATAEARAADAPLAAHLGIGGAALEQVFARHFSPRAFRALGLPVGVADDAEVEQELVRDLLQGHARDETGRALAAIIARRAMEPNHLWQDLGLNHRGELSAMLATHFPVLATGNVNNMKWKKYFYRRLCEAEGFVLCSAPSCKVCSDFEHCFGDESGESRLAQRRRASEIAATERAGQYPPSPAGAGF